MTQINKQEKIKGKYKCVCVFKKDIQPLVV